MAWEISTGFRPTEGRGAPPGPLTPHKSSNLAMSESDLPEIPTPDAVSGEVDGICDRFEAAWQAGDCPAVERYVEELASESRWPLLRELIVLDVAYRTAQEERPPLVDEYVERFPEFGQRIRVAWTERYEGGSGDEGSSFGADADLASTSTTGIGVGCGRDRPLSPAASPEDGLSTDEPVPSLDRPVLANRQDATEHLKLLSTKWPFSELPRSTIRAMLPHMNEEEFASGDVLMRQGSRSGRLLILLEGTVGIRVSDGDEFHDIVPTEGATLLGEMSLMTGNPCTATVVAKSPVRALTLPTARFHRLAEQHRILWDLLGQVVARRLGHMGVDVLVGKVFEGYRVKRCLGRGGMAVVYEAAELPGGRRVALKMMSHRFAHNLEAQGRFAREVEICQSLEHPNICRQYARFTEFGTHFMVMEFCDGETLDQLVQREGPLGEDQVRKILGQLAAALAYAHSRGVYHRDVKPSNLIVDGEGTAKLTDFGLAKSSGSCELTTPGQVVGTPQYMPPEQLCGEPVDHRCDVYAFGCVAYEMLRGSSLFSSGDPMVVLSQQFRWRLPPAEEIRAGLSDDLYAVLRGSLAQDPSNRTLDLERLPW